MTRPRTASLLIGLLACAALLVPALTSAALPSPTKPQVVKPFKSIGAVKLGMSKAQAISKWGDPGVCAVEDDTQQETCVWLDEGTITLPPEGAGVQISPAGKVCGLSIQAGIDLDTEGFVITLLKKWDTKEGIGLGSKLTKAKKVLGGDLIKKQKGITTSFTAGTGNEATQKQVGRINIFEKDCLVT